MASKEREDSGQSPTAKSSRTAKRSYSHVCGTDGWILPPSIQTLQSWMEDLGGGEWMSSLGDSLAKTSLVRENAEGLMKAKLVDFGEKWDGSFTKYDRDSSSWRTSQKSLDGTWAEFSETWPEWGMTRNGNSYLLVNSVHSTVDHASGSLLPTPQHADGRKFYYNMRTEGATQREVSGRQLMLSHVAVLTLGRDGKLTPAFVSWIMGYPRDWTNLVPLATPSSPR